MVFMGVPSALVYGDRGVGTLSRPISYIVRRGSSSMGLYVINQASRVSRERGIVRRQRSETGNIITEIGIKTQIRMLSQ